MPLFEFAEQAEIEVDTSEVFKALLDMNKWSVWWPGHVNKIRGDDRVIQNGSVVDIKVKGYSPITISFIAKIIDLVENQSIKAEWSGDLVGLTEWTLEAINGKTLVGFHIKARSNRLLITLFSIFLNPTKIFSKIMQSGFEGLQHYLEKEERS